MKDLDFDELDRAVSSLIGNSTQSSASRQEAGEKVLTLDDSITKSDSNSSVDKNTTDTKPPSKPFITKRSSGRFMDVVHPSSDMKTATMSRPSRQGVTVTPSANLVEPEPTPVSPAAPQPSVVQQPAPEPKQEEPVVYEDSQENSNQTKTWPDPLDFHSTFQTESATTTKTPDADDSKPTETIEKAVPITPSQDDSPTLEQHDASSPDQVSDTATSAVDETPDPLETPFITGAQVEKRPLGAFSAESPDVSSTEPITTPETNDTPQAENEAIDSVKTYHSHLDGDHEVEQHERDAQLPVESELPEELQDTLLSIESDTHEPVVAEDAVPAQPAAPSPTVPEASAVVSIPQQYKEAPVVQEQAVTSMYDVEPLKYPAKKKSGWMVVVWIIVLLLLGAGVGAAMYFFVIPLL